MVTKVFWHERDALTEADRMNVLNGAKDYQYFVRVGRVHEEQEGVGA